MSDVDVYEAVILVDPETGFRLDSDGNVCDWDVDGDSALGSFMIISEFSEMFDDYEFLGRLLACR